MDDRHPIRIRLPDISPSAVPPQSGLRGAEQAGVLTLVMEMISLGGAADHYSALSS